MQNTYWRDLIVETVRDPSAAARQLIGLQLGRDVLWTGLILAAALNALIFGLSEAVLSSDQAPPIPELFLMPLVVFAIAAGTLALFVYALTWVGRWLGGQGRAEEVMVLLVWLQWLRVLVQAAAFVVMMVLPGLAVLLGFAASLLGLWILMNFINVAHGFDNLIRSFFVMMGAALLMVFGVSFLLALMGPNLIGIPANV